jgi:diacylglycerol kinase family enzyme
MPWPCTAVTAQGPLPSEDRRTGRKANLKLLNLMLVTFLKRERPDSLELVEHWQGRRSSISSRPKQTIQFDGEIAGTMPLHIGILPGAVRVVCPRKDPE